MATFKAVTLTGTGQIKQDGTTNLKIRITHNRKAEYISTDIYIFPDELRNGTGQGDNAAFLNDRILDLLSKYSKAFLKLGDSSKNMTASEIKKAVTSEDSNLIDFIQFAENYYQQQIEDGRDGSVRAIRGLLVNLKAFSPKLYFHQIDSNYLFRFEKYLQKQGVGNGIQSYMSRFRVIFNKGRDQYNDEDRGIIRIPNYPFRKYQIKQPLAIAQNNCLSVNQVKILKSVIPISPREMLAKNMFLLMIYLIGINSKDLFNIGLPDKKGRIKMSRFKTSRFVTKREYSVKLEPEAIEIINKYKDDKRLLNCHKEYTDYLNFQKAINIGLNSICKRLHKEVTERKEKIDFPDKFTSNWARHTWATIARNDCGIDKDDVALCLGHEDKDNKVTDFYLKFDYSIIDKCNRKVLDKIS